MRLKKIVSTQNGMTLIELVVYLAIASVVLTSMLLFALNIIQSSKRTIAVSEVEHNLRFAKTIIENDIESATLIDDVNSIFDDTNGKLVIENNTDIITYEITDGIIYRDLNGDSAPVTTSRVTVNKMIFEDRSYETDRQSIKFSLNISFINSSNQKELEYDNIIESNTLVNTSK